MSLLLDKITEDAFNNWLIENNYTFDDYEQLHKKQIFDKIKNKFKELELNGIKSKIMCWTYDYIDLIKNDEYMNDRFIPILYDNKNIDVDNDEMRLTYLIEQEHRPIKRITKPMLGFKAFTSAVATLTGIELQRMLKKGQGLLNSELPAWKQFYALAG